MIYVYLAEIEMGCVIGGAVAYHAVALSRCRAHIIRPPVLRVIAEEKKDRPPHIVAHSINLRKSSQIFTRQVKNFCNVQS